MGLAYPLAETARDALFASDDAFASTLQAAQARTGLRMTLATEWLKPSAEEVGIFISRAEASAHYGFVQVYADGAGETVLAVSFWRQVGTDEARRLDEEVARLQAERARETTTDLYFTRPEVRRKRFGQSAPRRRHDPAQQDLFEPGGESETD